MGENINKNKKHAWVKIRWLGIEWQGSFWDDETKERLRKNLIALFIPADFIECGGCVFCEDEKEIPR